MAFSFFGILKGLLIENEVDRTKQVIIQASSAATTGTSTTIVAAQTANRVITLPDSNATLVTTTGAQTLSNKTLDNTTVEQIKSTNFTLQDTTDPTKQVQFDLTQISTGTTRSIQLPDTTAPLVTTSSTQTLTNKTINAASNTISNLSNSNLSGSAAISNANLASVANNTIKSNVSGISAPPSDNSISAILDSTLSNTQGSLIYRNASAWTTLSPGTSGQVLTTSGPAANPSWTAASLSNPMTTGGDIIYGGVGGTPTRLANGSASQVLTSSGGTAAPVWAPVSGSTPTGDPNTVSFFNAIGDLDDQTDFAWDGTHLGIQQSVPKGIIHAAPYTTSGTVGQQSSGPSAAFPWGAWLFGRVHATRNVGAGSAIFGSFTAGAGITNSCEGFDSLVTGRSNAILNGGISNTGCFTSGQNNTITATSFSGIIGDNCTITSSTPGDGGEANFISGVSSSINNSASHATRGSAVFGASNVNNNGSFAFIAGSDSTLSSDYSAAFGQNHIAQGYNQFIIGRFGVAQGTTGSYVSTDDAFNIGNGANAGSRNNAFTVSKDGKLLTTAAHRDSAIRLVTGADSISARTDHTIVFDTTTAGGNLSLPAGEKGLAFEFVSKGSGGATYTLLANGGDVFDPSATSSFTGPGKTVLRYLSGVWYSIS